MKNKIEKLDLLKETNDIDFPLSLVENRINQLIEARENDLKRMEKQDKAIRYLAQDLDIKTLYVNEVSTITEEINSILSQDTEENV